MGQLKELPVALRGLWRYRSELRRALNIGLAIESKALAHGVRMMGESAAWWSQLPTFTADTWLRQAYHEAGLDPPFADPPTEPAPHRLDLELTKWGVELTLVCNHDDPSEVRWFGQYDENGQFIKSRPLRDDCWAKEWADAEGVTECLHGPWPINPRFPLPVNCRYDDTLIVELA